MSPRVRWWLAATGLGYLALLALLVMWPNGGQVHRLNVDVYLFFLHRGVSPSVTPEHYAFVLNVLVFVPPVLLAALVVDRLPPWSWAVAGMLVSAAIELTQALVLPGRMASTEDLLANSSGAVLGAVAAYLLRARPPAALRSPGSAAGDSLSR